MDAGYARALRRASGHVMDKSPLAQNFSVLARDARDVVQGGHELAAITRAQASARRGVRASLKTFLYRQTIVRGAIMLSGPQAHL
jgi:hypothetical protein